jgi:hypothetical protein
VGRTDRFIRPIVVIGVGNRLAGALGLASVAKAIQEGRDENNVPFRSGRDN